MHSWDSPMFARAAVTSYVTRGRPRPPESRAAVTRSSVHVSSYTSFTSMRTGSNTAALILSINSASISLRSAVRFPGVLVAALIVIKCLELTPPKVSWRKPQGPHAERRIGLLLCKTVMEEAQISTSKLSRSCPTLRGKECTRVYKIVKRITAKCKAQQRDDVKIC